MFEDHRPAARACHSPQPDPGSASNCALVRTGSADCEPVSKSGPAALRGTEVFCQETAPANPACVSSEGVSRRKPTTTPGLTVGHLRAIQKRGNPC